MPSEALAAQPWALRHVGLSASTGVHAELDTLLAEGLLGSHERVRQRTRRLAERVARPAQGLTWTASRLPMWLALADCAAPLCRETYHLACHVVEALAAGPASAMPQVRLAAAGARCA